MKSQGQSEPSGLQPGVAKRGGGHNLATNQPKLGEREANVPQVVPVLEVPSIPGTYLPSPLPTKRTLSSPDPSFKLPSPLNSWKDRKGKAKEGERLQW